MSQDQRPAQCRACLSPLFARNKSSRNIFLPWSAPWAQFGSTIAVDLARISNVEIIDDSGYPHLMCHKCCTKLYTACEFIDTVQKSSEILKKQNKKTHAQSAISPKPVKAPLMSNIAEKYVEWPKPIQVEKSFNNEIYRGDMAIKQELLSDEEIPDLGIDSPEEFEAEKKSVSFVAKTSKKKKKIVELLENTSESKANNGAVKLAKDPTNKKAAYENEQYLEHPVKDEPVSDMELTLDIPLECLLCSKTLHTISGLKAHVLAFHNYKSVKRKAATAISAVPAKRLATKHTCAFCKRSFSTPTDLMVHETCHNMSVCYGCNHKFDTFDKLSKHRRRCKAASAQTPRMKTLQDAMRSKRKTLKCTKCDELFSDEYYMIIHNEIHHNSQAKNETKHAGDKEKISPKDNKDAQATGRQLIEIEILENILEETSVDTKADKIDVSEDKITNKSGKCIIQNVKLCGNGKSTAENENKKVGGEKIQGGETNDSQGLDKKNSNGVSSLLKESGLFSEGEVSKMSVVIEVENLETQSPQLDESSVDNAATVDGLQHVQQAFGVIKQNTEHSQMNVDNYDENLQTKLDSTITVDSKVDDLQELIQETEAIEEHTRLADTEGHKCKESVTVVKQNIEENHVITTEKNNIENLDNVHTNNEEKNVNAEIQELENNETNQSIEADESVNTEVNNLLNKENQSKEIIPENSDKGGSLNTEAKTPVINTEINETVNNKTNLSGAIFTEQTENAEDIDISLHNLVENIQSHIHDSDSMNMYNNRGSTLSDNIDVFEAHSKLLGNVQLLESNNYVQIDIAGTDVENTGKKLNISIETTSLGLKYNNEEIAENNTISEDTVTEENTEKSIGIDKFIKVNVTVESNIEMETQVEKVQDLNNKTEQEIYSNTGQVTTLDPEQINTKLDEIIAPSKIDSELLSTVIEDDG